MHGKRLTTNIGHSARICLLWVLGQTMLGSSLLLAATPREELLRLVPDSIGFCVVVQDMRGHAASLQASPLVEQLSLSSVALKIRNSDEIKKLDRIEAKLKEKLGLDWSRLRDDILGDALVLAYRPGPPGKPEQEQGVILLRARNEKVLAELIERVNKVQKEEGELKELEERRHNDTVYYRRLEFDKRLQRDKPPVFYYVHGAILALSSQESMLQQAIDCDRMRSADTEPEAARRLRELDAEHALLAVWINPRAFDAEVEAKVADTPAPRSAPIKHFARYWKALESVVVSATLNERDIQLSLGVRAQVEALPAAARRFFREGAAASAAWQRFPESALLAVGGRFDGAAFLDMLGGFLSPPQRQMLHAALNRQSAAILGEEDFVRDVLSGLGPDWGLCVTAPAAHDKGWMPQALLALRVDAAKTKKSLERKLVGALDFASRLVIFAHNNEHSEQPLTLKNGEVEGQEVRFLAGERGLPAGLQPSYGALNGYLLLASSLESMSRFARTAPATSSSSVVPLMRISVKDWKVYLREQREAILSFLVGKNNLSRADAAQKLDGLLAGLQWLDRIELHQRATSGQVIFTLSVQTTQALKK